MNSEQTRLIDWRDEDGKGITCPNCGADLVELCRELGMSDLNTLQGVLYLLTAKLGLGISTNPEAVARVKKQSAELALCLAGLDLIEVTLILGAATRMKLLAMLSAADQIKSRKVM